MGVYKLFGEYSYGLEKVTFTFCGDFDQSCSVKASAPNMVTFADSSSSITVYFGNLAFKPETANVLSSTPKDSETISLLASCSLCKTSGDHQLADIYDRIVQSEMFRCKFCDGVLANTMKINHVEPLESVDSLAESETSTFFCHAENQAPVTIPSPLFRLVSELSVSSALCNGPEVVLKPDAFIEDSLHQSTDLESVFCSRCRIMVGRLVGYNSDRVVVFWSSALNIRKPEVDKDGSSIRHIENPLVQNDLEFFEILLSHLVKSRRHRIVLSGASCDSAVDFALIWIFGQRTCLYNATLDTTKASFPADGDRSDAAEALLADQLPIMRVLYRRLPIDDASNQKDPKLVEWNRDFSVSHLRLPMEVCVSLLNCLSQVTQRLAPYMRSGSGAVEGFMIGGIPVKMHSG